MKELRAFKKIAWIAVAACVAIFFATSPVVYYTAVPNNVSELLTRDETWLSISELAVKEGKLENYRYVTKVYEYSADGERLTVRYPKRPDDADISYWIAEDGSLYNNYLVEFFVYSDIADKDLVARLWNITVEQAEELTLSRTNSFNTVYDASAFGDLKKSYSKSPRRYSTFMRISVKPGMSGSVFSTGLNMIPTEVPVG